MKQNNPRTTKTTTRQREIEKTIKAWKAYSAAHPSTLRGLSIRELIDDGRRF